MRLYMFEHCSLCFRVRMTAASVEKEARTTRAKMCCEPSAQSASEKSSSCCVG